MVGESYSGRMADHRATKDLVFAGGGEWVGECWEREIFAGGGGPGEGSTEESGE